MYYPLAMLRILFLATMIGGKGCITEIWILWEEKKEKKNNKMLLIIIHASWTT